MKHLFISLIILMAISASAQESGSGTLTQVGDTAPEFSFEIKPGTTDALHNYRGKLVLVNFFATWCPPCRTELPRIQKEVWEKYSGNEHFALLVFGREERWDVVTPFKAHNKYTFPILPDEGRKIYGLYATQSIPRNVLIDENGKIIYQSIGYEESEFNKLIALIESTLN